ncbi:troponin C-like isoform X2 [Dreissena polymorpha]|uniref:troponin C-like isoform X2 n=1 Tax=Dreissena polymorpha TaxID=45954 RepID=UPI002263B883|nr:troponin C-like isoform X2 [Dreissena polymorpha]
MNRRTSILQADFKVTDKQFTDAKQTFHLYQKKGTEEVATKDLDQLFKAMALHVDDDKLKDWADEMDDDAVGTIPWEKFKILFERKLKEDEEEKELKEAFRVLDNQKKGTIPVDDLRWILKSLGDDITEEEIDDMIAETDTDGSGTVDYEEFYALMMG